MKRNVPTPTTGFSSRLARRFARGLVRLVPLAPGWRGAAAGGLAFLAALLISAAYGLFGRGTVERFAVGAASFLAAFTLLGLLLTLIWRLLRALPAVFFWIIASALPALGLMALTAMSVAPGIVLVGLALLALAALTGAAVGRLLACWAGAQGPRRRAALAACASGLCLAAGLAWLLSDGSPPRPATAAASEPVPPAALALANPGVPGPYPVLTYTYGSGSDRRPEYGVNAGLLTPTVDGSRLVEGWSRMRTAYWGFGPSSLPLNALVWAPAGEGPFPLALIVHGQHPMEESSEPGYAYLGELLASRGLIVASVDENFLNLSPLTDLVILHSLRGENDLRAWLLLHHLHVWEQWNTDARSPFYHQVDLNRVALIGHSRGGEAAALAAAYSGLPCLPGDSAVLVPSRSSIRAVVGIAPVDSTELPAGREVTLVDTSYLVLHGAHDMDVFTFQGSRQYDRVRFTGQTSAFKASVYLAGANHGQFNSVWGRKDLFEPVMRVFNLAQLLPAADQQQAAAVTISAFLAAALDEQPAYRQLFQDLRRGQAWLPETAYRTRYHDSQTTDIASFAEDLNLRTTTLPGGTLAGEGLSVWREQPLPARWKTLGGPAAYLAWAAPAPGADAATYTVTLPQGRVAAAADSTLVFSLAAHPSGSSDGQVQGELTGVPIDFTIELVDEDGDAARLPLSHSAALPPPIATQLGKLAFFSPFPAAEPVLQQFEFSLADFTAANPGFDPERLRVIRFVFDRSPAGALYLDDIEIRPSGR